MIIMHKFQRNPLTPQTKHNITGLLQLPAKLSSKANIRRKKQQNKKKKTQRTKVSLIKSKGYAVVSIIKRMAIQRRQAALSQNDRNFLITQSQTARKRKKPQLQQVLSQIYSISDGLFFLMLKICINLLKEALAQMFQLIRLSKYMPDTIQGLVLLSYMHNRCCRYGRLIALIDGQIATIRIKYLDIQNHFFSPFFKVQQVASFWKSISIYLWVRCLQAALMASTLSSMKCCQVLSRVILLNEEPSSLTLVLDPMMTPGSKSSSRMAEQTAERVLLLDLCWVLFYLTHLDWIFLVDKTRTVFFSFFYNSVTNFLQRGVRRTLLLLQETQRRTKDLSF